MDRCIICTIAQCTSNYLIIVLKRALRCPVTHRDLCCGLWSLHRTTCADRELNGKPLPFFRGPLRHAPPDAEHLPRVRQEPSLLPPGELKWKVDKYILNSNVESLDKRAKI